MMTKTAALVSPAGDRPHLQRARPLLGNLVFYGFILMFVFAVLAPFVWMVISSVSPQVELTNTPPHWIPENFTLFRYEALLFGPKPGQALPVAASKFLRALLNSLVISTATTLVCMVAGSLAAFAFARLSIPGRQQFLVGILTAQMLPVLDHHPALRGDAGVEPCTAPDGLVAWYGSALFRLHAAHRDLDHGQLFPDDSA
jgi:ABC-type maltose transport system permease subunit